MIAPALGCPGGVLNRPAAERARVLPMPAARCKCGAGHAHLLQPSSPCSKSNRTRVPPIARTPSTPSMPGG